MKYLSLLFFSLQLFSGVVYEELPFFIPAYPTTFELLLTNGENPRNASILYKNSDMRYFQKITMECNERSCQATIPQQKPNSQIEYQIVVKLCSGKELKTSILILNPIPLPEWQKNLSLETPITIYSNNRELDGFFEDGVVFADFPHKINKLSKIKENNNSIKTPSKHSWWEFWNIWQNQQDNDNYQKEENEEEKSETQERSYKEIWTP